MKNGDKKKDAALTVPTLTSDDVRFVAALMTQPAHKPKVGFLAAREMHQRFFGK